jgi:hypothetical protein
VAAAAGPVRRLDDLLEAAGELVALAAATPHDVPEPEQDPHRQAADRWAVTGDGMLLTLPYVPARLVIEVSGPAENSGLLASAADGSEIAAGRLALVRDSSPRTARREAAGR